MLGQAVWVGGSHAVSRLVALARQGKQQLLLVPSLHYLFFELYRPARVLAAALVGCSGDGSEGAGCRAADALKAMTPRQGGKESCAAAFGEGATLEPWLFPSPDSCRGQATQILTPPHLLPSGG